MESELERALRASRIPREAVETYPDDDELPDFGGPDEDADDDWSGEFDDDDPYGEGGADE
jgi:hypothetical protein